MFPIFKKDLINSSINRKETNIFYNTGDLRWGKPSQLSNFNFFNKELSKKGFNFVEIKHENYHDINDYDELIIAKKKFRRK